ncbi:MAG: MBL fold metallo-hydrolase [Anaerolineae bacterium]|nr:MBL fold metallo-hydrolase [Anaerolineae bacterium]
MLQERVSADIYLFTSDLYTQVTAGVIVTPAGAILIDTLPFPVETQTILQFLSRRAPAGLRYIIYTHYHADHIYGASLFPEVPIIAHARCRQHLLDAGEAGLEAARAEAPDLLENVAIRLPDITLDSGEMILSLGGKTLRIFETPGHSDDGIAIYVEEDLVLFAGDAMMPIPTIVDGDPEALRTSLQKIRALEPESIVQGHGEVILRGEVKNTLRTHIAYLETIQRIAAEAVANERRRAALLKTDVEKCGIPRVALNGEAPRLHAANLRTLFRRMSGGLSQA